MTNGDGRLQAMNGFVNVLLPFGNILSNRAYTYSLPPGLADRIFVGDSVWVPFRSSTASGVVVGFSADPGRPTKPVGQKNTAVSFVPEKILELSQWLSQRYASSWWEALRGFLVAGSGAPLPERIRNVSESRPLTLTAEQEAAAGQVAAAVALSEHRGFLLHGITGSGKTEVYLRCAEEAIRLGKQVLVLVPEIPLSFHLSKRFEEHFGDRVAVFHSGLTEKEKRIEQSKLQSAKADIAVGPRAALFAPFEKLGLIVMDEEHDASYKQENSPRYHALTLASELAERHKAAMLLGSATPSLESYFKAKEGRLAHLTLTSRYAARELPPVEIVDLRVESSWEIRPFSKTLFEGLHESIANRKQSILFMNRRGFSPIVLCRDCGHTFYCPNCSITLTYHAAQKLLRCHYCDYRNRTPEKCPACGGDRLTHRGFGTERLAERVRELFPDARVLRLDRDISSKRGGAKSVLEAFGRGDADVLVGTQMVTKGFDFPNVGLVGILSADHLLHFPDFRSGERTFQLLTQAAGRTGRGAAPGRVILQAFDPEHPVIRAAANHDYLRFYETEIETRKAALYPPFISLANVLISGPDASELEMLGLALRTFLEARRPEADKSFLLGPAPCPIEKLSKNFRWHLLIKSNSVEELAVLAREIYTWHDEHGSRKVRLAVDIDPVRLL